MDITVRVLISCASATKQQCEVGLPDTILLGTDEYSTFKEDRERSNACVKEQTRRVLGSCRE